MTFISPSHLLLICVAAIWGFAFVAQSAGMDYLGPHSFNAARFLLGALSLVPLWFLMGKKRLPQGRTLILGGLAAGTIMFGGFSFQQIGLLYTTAGNAGFITGMYIVMVPIAGILLGQSTNLQTWSGVILAVLGLYSLSIGPDFEMAYGDLLELIGACFWTAHVIVIGWLSRKVDAIGLSICQFLVAAVWATIAALLYETPTLIDFQGAWLPLLYAGVASSGIACTLQIIGQRKVEPSVTALILSTEAIFAVIGGWLLLGETLGSKELLGCSLMLAGMLVSQWPSRKRPEMAAQG
ncbi:DMT family transporter [Motiliproteus coralliicola]|uniref:DMT family transporter n=1 Tax=Motiliproteus coralliicola TaxID=2283196 RepID=A0A369WU54_9GAMM|nr:DMT family transporter [Motiliproteus coralliicola]RDE25202.1 DMT family transporter [Motiliproteus coralliicola]